MTNLGTNSLGVRAFAESSRTGFFFEVESSWVCVGVGSLWGCDESLSA
jgi:hypothetical protein